MPDTPSPAYDLEAILQVKRDATRWLLTVPGVVAVGVGAKVIRDVPTCEPAVKVFVRKKLPPDRVPPDELIPPRVDGVITDIVSGGDPVPVTVDPTEAPGWLGADDREEPDVTTYRPLVGGCMISSVYDEAWGTGGCLVWARNDHDVVYMLTNYHVVSPDAEYPVKKNDGVGQPLGDDEQLAYDVIGAFAGGGMSRDRDEALVKLDAGMKWQAEIADIGVVTGTHTVTLPDLTTGKLYQVAKRGARTKLTGGWISSISTTSLDAVDGSLIVIQPNPNNGNFKSRFAIGGDSGSVIVNDAKQVVGLLCQGDPEKAVYGYGYALRIDHVLDRLRVTDGIDVDVATATNPGEVHEVPRRTFTEVPPEIAERIAAGPAERRAFTGTGNRAPVGRPWFSDVAPGPRTVTAVRDDLASCAAGRALIELWQAHREELRGLVDRNRRVTIAWYRGGGAALMQLMLRLPTDSSRTLPGTLSGVPLMTCVDRLADVLAREGSPALRDGLVRARALLPDLAGLSYPEIVAALRAKELIPDG